MSDEQFDSEKLTDEEKADVITVKRGEEDEIIVSRKAYDAVYANEGFLIVSDPKAPKE